MTALSYSKFIALIPGPYYKCVDDNLKSDFHDLKIGVNICTNDFIISNSYYSGGLYFVPASKLYTKIHFGSLIMEIILCDDAVFYFDEKYKIYKTNKFIMKNHSTRTDFLKNNDNCINVLNYDALNLRFIENQTYEICLLAVRNWGIAIKFVKLNQTEELCWEALKHTTRSIKYIIKQTYDMCLYAIKNDPYLITYINNPTIELCKLALDLEPCTISNMKQNEELCKYAVAKNGLLLERVKQQTVNICRIAINQNINAKKMANPLFINV